MSGHPNDVRFLVNALAEVSERPERMPYELEAIDTLVDQLNAQLGDSDDVCGFCGQEVE